PQLARLGADHAGAGRAPLGGDAERGGPALASRRTAIADVACRPAPGAPVQATLYPAADPFPVRLASLHGGTTLCRVPDPSSRPPDAAARTRVLADRSRRLDGAGRTARPVLRPAWVRSVRCLAAGRPSANLRRYAGLLLSARISRRQQCV